MVFDSKTYTRLAQYYDIIYSDKEYEKEVEFLKYLFGKYSKNKVTSVLDVACGTGNHAVELKKDFFVIGIDASKDMVDVAKSKTNDVDFFVENMKDFQLDRTFDSVVCMFNSFSYNLSDEEALTSLKNFNRHLEAKGVLIFDVMVENMPTTELHTGVKDDTDVARISKWTRKDKETAHVELVYMTRNKSKVDFHVDKHTLRVYNIHHLKRLAKKAGFKKVKVYNGFERKPYKKGNMNALFVAVKKGGFF